MKITTIIKGDEAYGPIKHLLKQQEKLSVDYESICTEYNELSIGGVLLIDLPSKVSIGNMCRVLYGRGITHELDFRMVRVKITTTGVAIPVSERPIAMERITPKICIVKPL